MSSLIELITGSIATLVNQARAENEADKRFKETKSPVRGQPVSDY